MVDRLQQRWGLRTDPVIFFVSAGLAVLFVVLSIAFTAEVDAVFAVVSGWILENLGWFYILGVTAFLVFLLWIALSRYGHVRLGARSDRPEFSNLAWFAMLFAAGIGTILMFWGVAEPISHFANPPMGDVAPESAEAATQALNFTLYHFALHTWTIFCLPALAFAYFAYRRRLPFRVSSIFQPLLGDRINGPIGKIIDVTAVVGTIFGVGVSIGLGTMQINSGLASLFGLPENATSQVAIIAVITGFALVSIGFGLHKGIKRLSNLNILMAVGLLIFVLVAGSTLYLTRGVIESTGNYLSSIVNLAFWNDTFAEPEWGWQGSWTVFYWAWTITWSPFIGIFIARISKGRSIKEFVLGVLGMPAAFSVIWFSIFGLSAIDVELERGGGIIEAVVEQGDPPGAMFAMFEHFPLTTFLSAVGILIVVIFLTTSKDSASLVLDLLCSGRSDEVSPTRQRVFWGLIVGAVAATLLAATGADGLAALEQVMIVVGLPFFVFGFLMIWSLLRALRSDVRITVSEVDTLAGDEPEDEEPQAARRE
ncbi:BCCT family transporter [Haloechinothrix sp. LS1_15]|uniref:BCCT family transporter n=1 Tax=Haloechinothrix sp. LS1_15 TaxID=2652248 RepID=UPI002945CA77|nr:BCCT family transporter [Haloechinothrix sp. LS1_15]MDV6011826.1 BCCT family transporter [Haloechinothrix sp. LS1_15]